MWRFLPTWPFDRSPVAPWLTPLIRPLRAAIVVILALSLCGCVNYDVGFKIRGQSGGEFVQVVRLGNGLGNGLGDGADSSDSIGTWIASLEQRTKALQGKVRRRADRSLELAIPFRNSQDLDRKFNQFFAPEVPPTTPATAKPNANRSSSQLANQRSSRPSLPTISAHLDLTEQNYLLFLHDRFKLDIDLRPLSLVAASEGADATLINPGSLLDLNLHLTTPWGSQINPDSLRAKAENNQLIWQLQPGKLNHLDASYWMPSPIGWGALIVIGLVALAQWFRSKLTPLPGGSAPIVE
jgi:hypothetical protein